MTDQHDKDTAVGEGSAASDMPGQKKLFIKTFGCQMNVYDSERMADAMRPLGYVDAGTAENADVIILNTCHIREKAVDKVYSELGRIREITQARRAEGKYTQVAVAGCVAQAEGAEIQRRAPVVDLVVGPQSYHRLPDLLFRSHQEGRSLIDTSFPPESKFDRLPGRSSKQAPSAFLTVQEGCDKFCTFCVVPYTRGAELSRPVSRIIEEARRLADAGVRELTLLGQNVNAYHGQGVTGGNWSLARLLAALAEIPGIERLRYTTSHPRDMSDDLIAAHGDNPKLMPYLHLPVQSGSDRVLAAMNRKHSARDYLKLIDRIRKARADIALSTDIIVGFPGETDEEFVATLAIVRAVGFAQAYSFKFSARPGTPAAGMAEQVGEDVKSGRLETLRDQLLAQQEAFNAECVGKIFPVLFERPGRHPGQVIGRSPYQQSVHAEGGEELIGELRSVAIASHRLNSLGGVISAA